jgi:hypothetical protein
MKIKIFNSDRKPGVLCTDNNPVQGCKECVEKICKTADEGYYVSNITNNAIACPRFCKTCSGENAYCNSCYN